MNGNITHVIFDLDGLLLDTERIFENIYRMIAEEHGKGFSWDIQLKIMGKAAAIGAEIIINELGLPLTVEEYMARTNELCETLLPNAQLNPGVEKLIRHLKRHNIPMSVATGSSGRSIKSKTSQHKEFFSLFDHVISAIEEPRVKRGKPFPDVFLFCASLFKDSPPLHKILIFEDSPVGKDAALAANIPVVMIPDSRLDRSLTEGATLVLDSMEHFVPEEFGLPPYDDINRETLSF